MMHFVLDPRLFCFDCEAAAKRRAEDCFLPDLDRTPGPVLATGSPFTRRLQASPTGGHCHPALLPLLASFAGFHGAAAEEGRGS